MQLQLSLWIFTGKLLSAHLADTNSDLKCIVRRFKARKPQSLVDALNASQWGPVILSIQLWWGLHRSWGLHQPGSSFEGVTVGRWGCTPLARKASSMHIFLRFNSWGNTSYLFSGSICVCETVRVVGPSPGPSGLRDKKRNSPNNALLRWFDYLIQCIINYKWDICNLVTSAQNFLAMHTPCCRMRPWV